MLIVNLDPGISAHLLGYLKIIIFLDLALLASQPSVAQSSGFEKRCKRRKLTSKTKMS